MLQPITVERVPGIHVFFIERDYVTVKSIKCPICKAKQFTYAGRKFGCPGCQTSGVYKIQQYRWSVRQGMLLTVKLRLTEGTACVIHRRGGRRSEADYSNTFGASKEAVEARDLANKHERAKEKAGKQC